MNPLRLAAGAALIAGLGVALWLEHRTLSRERDRQQMLQQQWTAASRNRALQRPLPPLASLAKTGAALPGDQWRELMRLRGEVGVLHRSQSEVVHLRADNARLRSNWVEQLAGGKKLAARDVAPYLQTHQRSAASLVAAAFATGDPKLLREAEAKAPADPAVRAAAFLWFKGDAAAGESRDRLEAWKQAAPDNALANYLSAREYFKAGEAGPALTEILAATAKPTFQDYRSEIVAEVEAAYRAAGLSELEAAVVGSGHPLPQLAELKALGDDLGQLARRYREAGDEDSARAALQCGVVLGRQVREPTGSSLLIGDLVGIAIERQVLGGLDPSQPYDDAGLTVKDRLDELARQKASVSALLKQSGDPLQRLSPAELAGYFERLRTLGERAALDWAASQPRNP